MLKLIHNNPEILFIFSVLFYWFSTSYLFNPFAIVLFIVGLIMMTKKFKPLAIIVGFFYLMINAYMVLALISEFREFPNINSKAMLMMGVGSSFLAINFYISIRLILNNIPAEGKQGRLD
jgi:hypothetical protein